MDLMDRFEEATRGGPEHRGIEARLVAGRRAQARRRATVASTAFAGTLVIGGLAWAVLPGTGSPTSDTDGVVASEGLTEPDSVDQQELPSATPTRPTVLFQYDLDTATLNVADGVTVLRQVNDPVPDEAVTSSAAVVKYQGERKWVMAAVVPGRSGWASDTEANPDRDFEQWVHELTVLNTPSMSTDGEYEPGWVTLNVDGGLTAHNGATIVDQSTPARIDQSPATAPSAVGTINVDGALLCVVARMLPGKDVDVTYLAESEHQGCGDAVPGIDYPGAPATS
ncbi:hypothetical protein Pve01_83400 [Planomonospora venezuelensis]|nr:hypothetical protein Pve01_83400 [Planomonospora venezuelensis]